MAITSIQNVGNITGEQVVFVNLESSGNNRVVDNGAFLSVGNCWVPWCDRGNQYAQHHIEIRQGTKILYAIWQKRDEILYSTTDDFNEARPVQSTGNNGKIAIGRAYNLVISPEEIKATLT